MNLVAVAFNQGSTLIASIIVARTLLRQGFGEYSMVLTTLLTMVALSQLATGYTAAKYIAEFRTRNPSRAGRIMGACASVSLLAAGLGAGVLIVIAPWLSGSMLNAPHLATGLGIGAVFLFFSSINGYQVGALSGLEAYDSLAKAGVTSGVVAVAAISLGAQWGGLNGALVGLGVSAILRCSIHHVFLRVGARRHGIRPRYRGSLAAEKKVVMNFTLPAAISGYYSLPMIWLASAFLVRQAGGFEQFALYAAANNLRILILFLPNVMNTVGLSILNNEKSLQNVSDYRKTFLSNVSRIVLVTLAGVVGVSVLGRPMLELFGKEFGAGQMLLWILLFSAVFEGTSIGLYQYIQARARMWSSLLFINVPREFVLVAAAYWFVQTWAGVGLAAAYFLSSFVGLILTTAIVRRLWRAA